MYVSSNGGRSANKFRKSQIRKFLRTKVFVRFADFWQANADLDQKHCFFPDILADLQFADWDTEEIWGAICGIIITNLRICGLRTGTPQKFADLRLRNEAKNVRICGLLTNKKLSCPSLVPSVRCQVDLRPPVVSTGPHLVKLFRQKKTRNNLFLMRTVLLFSCTWFARGACRSKLKGILLICCRKQPLHFTIK